MEPTIIFIIIFFFAVGIHAQNKKIFKVNVGEKVVEAIPRNEMYKYPEFVDGKVLLRDGSFAVVNLNYNSLFGEMQFIDPKGDTISVADERNIAVISAKADSFYYDNGFLEQIDRYGKLVLAKKRLLVMTNKQKLGAMDQAGVGDVETYTSMTGNQNLKELVAKEILTFSEKISFYIADEFYHFNQVNKKNLTKMFAKDEKKIEDYLKEKKTDFNKQADVEELCKFLQEL